MRVSSWVRSVAVLAAIAVLVVSAWLVGRPRADEGGDRAGDRSTFAPPTPDVPSGNPSPSPTPSAPAAVTIAVGDDVQAVIDRHPPGTTFVLASGVHRAPTLTLRDGDVLRGEPGAVLSGARVVEDFERVEGRYVRDGIAIVDPPTSGRYGCRGWRERELAACGHEREVHYPNELFVDGVRWRHVNDLDDVDSEGEWYLDYERGRVHLGADPTGRSVELSVVDRAVAGAGVRDVVIEDLTIRNFANPAQVGALDGSGSIGWTIQHVEVADNHGGGLAIGRGMHVRNVRVVGNGQIGVLGQDGDDGPPVVVEDSEIAFNRTLGFDEGWEAGGTKFVGTDGLVFRNNWVHDNHGAKGVWFDISNRDAVITSNLIEDNDVAGIFYEISFGALIEDNIVRGNGTSGSGRLTGGIFVVDSPGVTVRNNHIVDNIGVAVVGFHQNRRTTEDGPTEIRDLEVTGNEISGPSGTIGVIEQGRSGTPFEPAMSNRFEDNLYRLGRPDQWVWWWDGRELGFEEWRAAGQDRGGTLERPRNDAPATALAHPFVPATYGPRGG